MARLILPRRPNPFAFPGGSPGFDPAHPMARGITPSNGFSGVALGGNMVDLQAGKAATIAGAPTRRIYSSIGPTVVYSASTDESQFTGRSTTVNANNTYGFIFQLNSTNVNDATFFVQSFGAASGLVTGLILLSGTSLSALINAAPVSVGAFTFSLNVPYFLGVSYSTTKYNSVLRRLDNGKIIALSGTGTFTSPASADGSYAIGNVSAFGAFQLDGGMAATMFAPTFHSSADLVAWSQDPWSFWYRPFDFGLLLASDVLMAQVWI